MHFGENLSVVFYLCWQFLCFSLLFGYFFVTFVLELHKTSKTNILNIYIFLKKAYILCANYISCLPASMIKAAKWSCQTFSPLHVMYTCMQSSRGMTFTPAPGTRQLLLTCFLGVPVCIKGALENEYQIIFQRS